MLDREQRELLQALVKYSDITSLDVVDLKHDEAVVNVHTAEGASEEEVLFLLGEVFPDVDFGEGEVLCEDENNCIQTVVFSSQACENEYGVEINIYFKREYEPEAFDDAM